MRLWELANAERATAMGRCADQNSESNVSDLSFIGRHGRQTIEPVAPTSVQAEKNDCSNQYS